VKPVTSTTLKAAHEEPGRTERTFVVLVMLFSAGAFASAWTVPGQLQSAAGMIIMQVLWILVYIVTLYLYLRHCGQPIQKLFSEWPLVALCAFAMLSTFWSQVPGLTFRRSAALILTLLFGIYLGFRFGLKEQLRLLAWACAICIFFSFIFGALGLGNAIDSGEGVLGWYGIFDQKNALGRMMVFSALVFLSWKTVEPQHRRLANAALLGSVVLIALSRSMTSIVVLALLMILLPYLRWAARRSERWMVGGILFLTAVGTSSSFYVATHLDQVTGLLGKSATLTGRVQIWILSTVMALRRPWLGYGYNAFWLPNEWFTVRIWQVLGWKAPHAHNGFLELWLELGLVGAGLFFLVFVYYVGRGITFLARHRAEQSTIWPIAFLFFLFLSNLTETDLLVRNNLFFILFVALAVTTKVYRAENSILPSLATDKGTLP
jgi:exopolysaccharide production protein ExoQ